MKQIMTSRYWKLLALLTMLILLSAYADEVTTEPSVDIAESKLIREMNPSVDDEMLSALTAGNSMFAFEMLRILASSDTGNVFFSPYSVSVALAMAYAGAAGDTATQISDALNFPLDQALLHAGFNRLNLELASRDEIDPLVDGRGFQLNLVNAIWGQRGHQFLNVFLDMLATNYGAGVRLLDFSGHPEESRKIINDWVSERTNERIQDLLPPETVDVNTRLILTNAIYFNVPWYRPFNQDNTRLAPFTNLNGDVADVHMMHQTETFRYGSWDEGQAIELLYHGRELAMVVLVPDETGFESMMESLTAEWFSGILSEMRRESIALGLPKFQFTYEVSMVSPLIELGMTDAFKYGLADFSNIDGTRDLAISDVLHKAFVAVDEAGTEAAAATAVGIKVASMPRPPISFIIDRPFVFVIRDIPTGTILFIGQVTTLPADNH